MKEISPTTFAEHVENSCGALVRDAAPAIGADIEVLDETGRVVLRALRDEHAGPPKWAFATTIEAGGTIVGKLRSSTASEASRALLSTLAHDIGNRVATAVEMGCMIERLSVCYDELDLLHRMSAAAHPDKRVVETSSTLLGESMRHMRERTLFLYLSADDHLEFRTGGSEADLPEDLAGLAESRAQYRELVVALAGGGERVTNEKHSGVVRGGHTDVHYTGFAVRDANGIAGFVGIHHRKPSDAPDGRELKMLACLARELTDVATRGAMLDELRDMLFNTVKSLVAAVDAKDVYTRGHSERVYRLSVSMGEHLGISSEEMQNLAWAALLHDIGKIAIPEEVLRKTTALSDDEVRLIQGHPLRGERLLEPISQLGGVLPGVRNHHERVDGRGYPDQLAGEEIPLIARIIAVADTYDALVSTRAYRRARTREFALREIERSAGTQLDAEVVRVFLEIARAEGSAVLGPEELSDAA
jgi:HD-GYP domain-containing protein (c-di-GMP phosphodiesterase class II)